MSIPANAGEFPYSFAVFLATGPGEGDARERSVPFIGNEQVFAGFVRAHLSARRAPGDELSTAQAGLFEAVKIEAHDLAGKETKLETKGVFTFPPRLCAHLLFRPFSPLNAEMETISFTVSFTFVSSFNPRGLLKGNESHCRWLLIARSACSFGPRS